MGLEIQGKREARVLLGNAGGSWVPHQPCPGGVRSTGAPVPEPGRWAVPGTAEGSVLGLWQGQVEACREPQEGCGVLDGASARDSRGRAVV